MEYDTWHQIRCDPGMHGLPERGKLSAVRPDLRSEYLVWPVGAGIASIQREIISSVLGDYDEYNVQCKRRTITGPIRGGDRT